MCGRVKDAKYMFQGKTSKLKQVDLSTILSEVEEEKNIVTSVHAGRLWGYSIIVGR